MSENQQQPVVIVEKQGSGFAAFLWGAILGAGAALLFAPMTGQEAQDELREGARRVREGAGERLTEIRGSVGQGVEKARAEVEDRVDTARESVRERRRRAEEALKAGKDAATRARSDLEQRVAESKAAYKAALDVGDDGDADDADEEAEAS